MKYIFVVIWPFGICSSYQNHSFWLWNVFFALRFIVRMSHILSTNMISLRNETRLQNCDLGDTSPFYSSLCARVFFYVLIYVRKKLIYIKSLLEPPKTVYVWLSIQLEGDFEKNWMQNWLLIICTVRWQFFFNLKCVLQDSWWHSFYSFHNGSEPLGITFLIKK